MHKRVKFSGEHLEFAEIAIYHNSVEKALKDYFSKTDVMSGEDPNELQNHLIKQLDELDKRSCLSILSTIEATLRVDYLRRCQEKWRDPLSRKMRRKYEMKGAQARLDDDILKIWEESLSSKVVISEIKEALKYRHWLAHGRYWVPKHGGRYDFFGLFLLANQMITVLRISI